LKAIHLFVFCLALLRHVSSVYRLFLSKKLKEVTDKKKNAVLKDIDEKLTRTAKELGYSLEQKTMKMKQRDKKV